jgi:hypothetical protein
MEGLDSGLRLLLDERSDVVGLVLSFMTLVDVLRFGMTCKRAFHLVQDDTGVWERALEEMPGLTELLRLPDCFWPRKKLQLAVGELQKLRKEADSFRAELERQEKDGTAQLMQGISDFIAQAKEPLHESNNPFHKENKTKRSQEDKNISKMLQSAGKIAHTKVLLIGTDPTVLLSIAQQAVEFRPQGGPPPDASVVAEQRAKVHKSVLALVQKVAAEAIDRLGPNSAKFARAVLNVPLTEDGFASVASSVQALWNDERMREASATLCDTTHRTSLKRNLCRLMEHMAVERLLGPERWPHVSASNYVPTQVDMVMTAEGNNGAIQESQIVSKGFRIRLLDASTLLLNCKRSKLVPMLDDVELVVFACDMCPKLPGRSTPDESFGAFEQLKLFEALASSRWFKKTLIAFIGNVAGLEKCVESAFQSPDTARHIKFLRSRIKVISRSPQQLSLLNIRLVAPTPDSKLIEFIIRTIADLFLSRNVQKGF